VSTQSSNIAARRATVTDAPRITAIYNQGIVDRVATFETEPRTEETVRGWFDTRYPIVVVEQAGDVIAWAGTSAYRPRACYAGIAEFSVYVDRDARGHGAGRVAMQALIAAAREEGFEKLVSRVFTENHASRKLLRSIGFREVGIYELHAQLDGVWRDVVIVEFLLQDHTAEPHGELWQPDLATLELWSDLTPGSTILVEKRNEFATNGPIYPAVVVESTIPEPWIEVQAEWTTADVDVAGLPFVKGDELREFFSPRHPFNAFAIYAPDGYLRGWYANVTRPARCERHEGSFLIAWPDLILDLVMLPDGSISALDEDELEDSGLAKSNPELRHQIIAARDELRRLLLEGFFPTLR